MMGDRCRIHCPPGGLDAVVAAVAVAAAVAGLVLAVVAAVGPLLVTVMSVLCAAGVVTFAVLMRRGGAMWRPPSRRVRVALEAAAAAEAIPAAERPAIAAASAAEFLAQLPVYAVITDVREARGR